MMSPNLVLPAYIGNFLQISSVRTMFVYVAFKVSSMLYFSGSIYVPLWESELPRILLSRSRIYTLASTRSPSVSAVFLKSTVGDLRRKLSRVRNFSSNVVMLFSLTLLEVILKYF